jgi:muramoyltetrapeptide carboxypeptidase
MLNRRDFARLSLTAAAAAATAPRISAAPATKPPTIKPKRLTPGDTVGLVLPASAAFEADEIQFAKEQMEAIGFKVVIGPHAFDKWGYFAGRDRDRADDINRMFADDQINGVVCYTGGWGSPRVLPYLDYDLIARKPKVLIGYSDITALLNAVHKKTGLITFHGPVGGSTFEPWTLENFRRVVMTAAPAGLLPTPPKKANELIDRTNRVLHLTKGTATGPLIGGNLTMISTLMGTPYQPDTTGAIVFLEDVHEEPYRIDRMLTTLSLGGLFDHAAGIVFGRCSDCGVKGPSFSLEEILRDRFGSLPIPAISGLSFGHIEQKLVLPIGARATLDADAGTVRVEEGAVG